MERLPQRYIGNQHTNQFFSIPSLSRDPAGYKKAAFWSLFTRALTYCTEKEDLKKELDYIKTVGLQHGYSRTFLTKVLNQVKSKITKSANRAGDNPDNIQQHYTSIPYHLKNVNIVKKTIKNKNKCIATKRNPTVFNILRNEKDRLKDWERSGVYKIPINDLQHNKETAYVGVTVRPLAKRINEHKNDIKTAKMSTSLAQEAYDNNIEILWNEAKIIKPIPPHTQPTIVESLEITRRKSKEGLINDKVA